MPGGGAALRLCSTRVAQGGINKPVIDRIIRVDHAGEYGANRIYAGQMAVLGRSSVGPVIQVSAPGSDPLVLFDLPLINSGPVTVNGRSCHGKIVVQFFLCTSKRAGL